MGLLCSRCCWLCYVVPVIAALKLPSDIVVTLVLKVSLSSDASRATGNRSDPFVVVVVLFLFNDRADVGRRGSESRSRRCRKGRGHGWFVVVVVAVVAEQNTLRRFGPVDQKARASIRYRLYFFFPLYIFVSN